LSENSFRPIAEREFKLRGPAERVVSMRIGTPEPEPGGRDFRCPFQVIGLSDDAVQYVYGVDSFQALNLAFVALRNLVKTNASVLAAFHKDFSLTWEETPWETALPVWVHLYDADHLRRLDRFLEEDLFRRKPAGDE
jgi:hypothetical protein